MQCIFTLGQLHGCLSDTWIWDNEPSQRPATHPRPDKNFHL